MDLIGFIKKDVMNTLKQTCGPNPVTQIETLRIFVGRLWHLLPNGLYPARGSTAITYSTHFLRVLPITVQYFISYNSHRLTL